MMRLPSRADSDVAIRFGHGNYPALHSEFMFREQLFPVASPALLQRFGTPQEPAELLRYPLLMRDGADLVPKWEIWFKQVGLTLDALQESVRFADTNMTLEAALLGRGWRAAVMLKELRDGSRYGCSTSRFPRPPPTISSVRRALKASRTSLIFDAGCSQNHVRRSRIISEV